jgi:hypothetical protein
MDLQTLLDAQATFERALVASRGSVDGLLDRRCARDLDLSHQVLVAKSSGRLMQIQLEDDVVPTAFLKNVGVDYSDILLQVLVSVSDLRVEACLGLFDIWIDRRATLAEVRALTESF